MSRALHRPYHHDLPVAALSIKRPRIPEGDLDVYTGVNILGSRLGTLARCSSGTRPDFVDGPVEFSVSDHSRESRREKSRLCVHSTLMNYSLTCSSIWSSGFYFLNDDTKLTMKNFNDSWYLEPFEFSVENIITRQFWVETRARVLIVQCDISHSRRATARDVHKEFILNRIKVIIRY